jgi:hypothetical protein
MRAFDAGADKIEDRCLDDALCRPYALRSLEAPTACLAAADAKFRQLVEAGDPLEVRTCQLGRRNFAATYRRGLVKGGREWIHGR